jgi:hypothetical protein
MLPGFCNPFYIPGTIVGNVIRPWDPDYYRLAAFEHTPQCNIQIIRFYVLRIYLCHLLSFILTLLWGMLPGVGRS